jgi:adenosylcobinamide-GDP ribazoletransferase
LLLRAAAIAALAGENAGSAAAALIAAGGLSRACGLAPMALLGPARLDGASASVGRLATGAFLKGVAIALLIAVILGVGFIGFGRTALAFLLAAFAALAMTTIAQRQIGGQTGDVAGAAQQLAEIAFLCGLLIGAKAA